MRLVLSVFVLIISIPAAVAQDFPKLTGRVVDDARVLSTATEAALSARLAAWEETSSDQIVIVTVQSLGNLSIEDYGYRLGREWGIGVGQTEGEATTSLNNGILLIVAPNDRQVRIEVGYGLEGTLTDAASSVIINRGIVPAFRQGDFDAGVTRGLDGILAVLEGQTEEWMDRRQRAGNRPVAEGEDGVPWPLIFFLLMFVLPMVLRRRSGVIFDSDAYQRRHGSVTSNALAWMIASQMSQAGRRGGGFSSGGFSGGGGFGGGFSGGGGSFGGGGASGSW
ncbi:MAG: TPM domain-containing protein [Pseudomonadota bacterium]